MFKFGVMEISWLQSKLANVIALILVALIATPFLLPSFVYQNIIENRLEQATGLDIEFVDNFSFSLFPYISLEADMVEFKGNLSTDVATAGTIDHVTLEISFWKFLTGRIHIHDFRIESPKATVNGDFLHLLPQWVRNKLRTSDKRDLRYEEIFLHFVEDSVFEFIEISNGTLQWNKADKSSVRIQKFRLSAEKPIEGKDLIIKGNASVNERSVDLNMRLERPDEFIRGFRSKLSLQLDSSPLRIDFNGNAAHRRSFIAQGTLKLDIPSTYEFCQWFKLHEECVISQEGITLKSDLRLRDQRLQIEKATYMKNDFTFKGEGEVSFQKSKPEITGIITIPTREVDSLNTSYDFFKELDFSKLLLETFDADVMVNFQGIKLTTGDTLKPNIGILVDDGRLTISSDQLALFGGGAKFRLRWNKGVDDGYMDLRFDANAIDLKALQDSFSKNIGLTGVLNSSFEIQSIGSHLVALLETARIQGDFTILDGAFTFADVVRALSGVEAKSLDFAEAKGRLKGDRGQLAIRDIEFTAPFIELTGVGNFDFLNKSLNVQIKSQIPERKKSDGSVSSEQMGYIRLNGPLNDIRLETSANPSLKRPMSDGLHSGLLPYKDDTDAGTTEAVIETTDLLD